MSFSLGEADSTRSSLSTVAPVAAWRLLRFRLAFELLPLRPDLLSYLAEPTPDLLFPGSLS